MPRLSLNLNKVSSVASGALSLDHRFFRNFVAVKELNPADSSKTLTYTGSGGTFFNSSGVMVGAVPNEPRFDWDPVTGEFLGLLIEPTRTNLYTDSFVPAVKTITLDGSKTYILSFYGDQGTSISFTGATAGTLSQSSSVRRFAALTITGVSGNVTFTPSAGATYPQLEEGLFPTSHIPTGATPATRTADTIKTASGIAGNFGAFSFGTLVCEFSRKEPFVNGQSQTAMALSFSSIANHGMTIRGGYTDGNTIGFRGVSNGSTRTSIATANLGLSERNRIHRAAATFTSNYGALSLDGSLVSESVITTFNPTSLGRIEIGSFSGSPTSYLMGHVRAVEFYGTTNDVTTLNVLSSSYSSSQVRATANAPFELRILTLAGTNVGRPKYVFGDEVIQWEGDPQTGSWVYKNTGLGVISNSKSNVMHPWQAKWGVGTTITRQ